LPQLTDWIRELRWTFLHVKFWRPYRILGRFQTWKRLTRFFGRARGSRHSASPWMLSGTVFDSLSADEIAANLRDRGYHPGLQMPADLVADLRRHAEASYCRRTPRDRERFLIGDVRDGRSPLGNPVAVADVETGLCAATARVVGDAALIKAVERCLGYRPSRVVRRLYWSPASVLSDDERRWNGQTIDYHYDIEPDNALYLYFYLSDTSRHDGAHVLVAESHRSKTLRMKLGSTRQSEQIVLGHYGSEKVVVLEGEAGFGFFEDPACFHKMLPPSKSNRLMLQFRYS
jgi:hypothetical protein